MKFVYTLNPRYYDMLGDILDYFENMMSETWFHWKNIHSNLIYVKKSDFSYK